MSKLPGINLGSALRERVNVLELRRDEAGNYAWHSVGSRYAAVEMDAKKNIFSDVGIGARGATITLRPDRTLTLHHALQHGDQFLFLTSIVPTPGRDAMVVKAAVCQPVTFTAEPESRKGRDEMNRPTVEKTAAFTFPGVLTELYRMNLESEEVSDTDIVRRVVVTPKAIVLRKGEILRHPNGTAYPIHRIMDLDEFKTSYIVRYQEDA